jgi:hypothetical protein
MPASAIASVRPALAMTFVFGAKSLNSVLYGPGRAVSPSASATSAERTQRLRYHSARPSRSRTPWTMPSPTNQWCVSGSGCIGFGPMRT